MTDFNAADRDVSRAIRSWLHEDRHEDVSRVAGAVLDQVDTIPQRRATWWPARRTPVMNKIVTIGLGAAAVVVALLVGTQLLGSPSGGVGSEPSPTATLEPTATPEPTAEPTPESDPEGVLAPGTYVARLLPAPNDSLTVTFTVPAGWSTSGGDSSSLGALIPAGDPDVGPPGGIMIQFDDVTTLNGDPCDWSGTADDVSVGPAVDDLVNALLAQTAYEVSDPMDVTIGGYSGKRVDIVHPTEPFAGESADAPDCDDGNYRIWSTRVHGPHPIYGQGPANRWQTNVLDVDGTRLVIVAADFPGTSPADHAEMDAIIDSFVIEP